MQYMSTNKQAQEKLVRLILDHPEQTYTEVAATLGCPLATISRICTKHGVRRKRKALSMDDLNKLEGFSMPRKLNSTEE
jgi:DNA invertase Pin-like site-specific DNA recombinase